MMERRSHERRKKRVTDEDVMRWVEEEESEFWMSSEMDALDARLSDRANISNDRSFGSIPEKRPDGVWRAMSIQLNNMSTSKVRNRKARRTTKVVRKYSVQMACLGEVGVNWDLAKTHRLLSLLPELQQGAKSMTAHNKHEKIAIHQQGGVGTIVMGEVLTYYKRGARDFRKLGRWTSFVLQSVQNHRTRIVQAYAVGPVRSQQWGSVYQQHVRYMQFNGLGAVTPRELFESDLLWQLQVWRALGDRIILIMDANCHVLTGKLCRDLYKVLGMREITKDHLGSLCDNTHPSGSQQIDGVWATSDITITAVKWLSYSESPGDHRSCIFDFTTLSAIGSHERSIVLPGCRRLISTHPTAFPAYEAEMNRQFDIHRVEERLARIDEETMGLFPVPQEYLVQSEILDKQVAEIQLRAESVCRIIHHPEYDFSPEISLWHQRKQMFKRMIRMHEGRVKNIGLLCKQARKLGIVAPKRWSLADCHMGVAVSKSWKRRLGKFAPGLRFEHNQQCLLEAEAEGDVERAKAIRAMMTREESANMWSQLGYTFSDNGGRSNAVTRVEREEFGEIVEYTEQEDVERVVREMTQDRFTLADSSPLCNGMWGEQLGFLADTEVARAILDGTFVPPPDTPDSLVLILDEIARIAKQIGAGAVRLLLSAEEFKRCWKPVDERTSSSKSKLHMGHYKAAARIDRLAAFFARKLTFIARSGWAPSRWGNGLTVLLEKIAGIALVNKLRAILLFEADSNMFNRFVFADRAMAMARQHNLIPSEQYAERQSEAADGNWSKRLFADISRQAKLPIGIVSADAESCYDRVAHVFASLVFQAFGVGITAITAMLASIQTMKFYLRTGLGESLGYMSAIAGSIIQGLCQGNTAAPAGWSLISAVLIKVYKRMGHGAVYETPITRRRHNTAGVLYVDDVDLFSMNSSLTSPELWEAVASSTRAWTELLTIPGGAGKGEKCFGYLIDYAWDDTGQWYYAPVSDMQLDIVLPDGSTEGIVLLPATASRVTLGVATSPDGIDDHHLKAPGQAKDKWKSIATRAQVWADRLKNGHLPSKFAWVSYRLQLWSSVKYGLGTLSTPLASFGELTYNFAYNVLPFLGVNRNIRSEWRYLHNTFGGVGLLSLSTETIICRVNLFLQHWGMPTPIGTTLRTSMEYMHLEAGCIECPLVTDYEPMGPLVTYCWLQAFWESVSYYGLHLEVDYPALLLPRENDFTIMWIVISLGYRGDDLRSINRCRIACCAIFLSCVASANGKFLDPSRVIQRSPQVKFSSFNFPREQPSTRDWEVWLSFWQRYCLPDGSLPRSLGKWRHHTHRIWEWFFHTEGDFLVRRQGDDLWKYCPCPRAASPYSTRHAQFYGRVGKFTGEWSETLVPATVRKEAVSEVLLLNIGSPLVNQKQKQEESFWTFLRDWGGDWMWDDVQLVFGIDALVDALSSGSAILVTDGSYSRHIRADIDGAGWLVYCTTRKKIILKATFYEQCLQAGSYRGELCGLLAVHLLVLAVEQFYELPAGPRGLVACDNLGGLNKSKERRRKISPSTKHADILRALRRVHGNLSGTLSYKHVYGHARQKKTWQQMSLLEKLNDKCDALAKNAVHRGIQDCIGPPSIQRQRLPLEPAALFYNGHKIVSECGKEIRFQIGRREARQFYINQLGWYAATFDNVDWQSRDSAIGDKPDMFKMWLCKQTSTFCASGKNMGRWFGSEHTSCPNCNAPDEDAAHLLHCRDAGRFALFRSEVEKIVSWLQQSHTDPELAAVLIAYLRGRGRTTLCSIRRVPAELRAFAFAQDQIGWDNFMMGMISYHIRAVQYSHLLGSSSLLTVDDWMKQFIGQLLHVTHGQWIYRNISKYHDTLGQVRKTERRQLLLEIDRLIHLNPDDLPEESKFLLEVDFARLRAGDLTSQHYWVYAIKAARAAMSRKTFFRRRRAAPFGRRRVTVGPPIPYGETDDRLARGEKRKHGGAGSVSDKVNKRLRKPD